MILQISNFKDLIAACKLNCKGYYFKAYKTDLINNSSFALDVNNVKFFVIDFTEMSMCSSDRIIEMMILYRKITNSRCRFVILPILGTDYTKELLTKAHKQNLKSFIIMRNFVPLAAYSSNNGYIEDFFPIRTSQLSAMMGIKSILIPSTDTKTSKFIINAYRASSVLDNFTIFAEGPKNLLLANHLQSLSFDYYWIL